MIQYRVVAVPQRLEAAMNLAAKVDGQVVLDEHGVGAFQNHLRALKSVESGTHAVILEDDAILCPDFMEHVERLIRERPDHLLGLYVGRSHPKRVQPLLAELVEDSGWLDDPLLTAALRWGVGYVMPTRDIPAVLELAAQGDQHAWMNTDRRIGAWHASQGLLSYPLPSPVDHDDSLPSMTSGNRSVRVAWVHCGGRGDGFVG